MTTPHAELRDAIRDKLAARWRERAAAKAEDTPEGHCGDLADAVMELFTVEEDHHSIDVRQMQDESERTIRHRRLVAKTDWTPVPEPAKERSDTESEEK